MVYQTPFGSRRTRLGPAGSGDRSCRDERGLADVRGARGRLAIVSDELSAPIVDEVARWPEFRMGAHRVRVVLADGQVFDDVMTFRSRHPTWWP